MISNTTKPGAVPRLAMINSFAGFGRCSTTVSLPVISALGIQACPAPTSILSNHLGFPTCYFQDYTPHLRDYLKGWADLGLTFDGLYCGFLGSTLQIAIVEEFLQTFQPAFFLLDPVMGDHGKAYSTMTKEHCSGLRSLARHAHIFTPNITEACLLTDTPYKDAHWTEEELSALCRKLEQLTSAKLVITGLRYSTDFVNYIWENGNGSTYTTPVAGASRPGTGDLFASVLAADALNGIDFTDSVKRAADFVGLCIRGSEEAHIPIQEGVIFEKYLRFLLTE